MTVAPPGQALHVRPPQRSAAPISLIVHADDYGETQEITDGITLAVRAGAVTSTSIMANMPATDYALEQARALGEGISLGVHLNFCEGRALTGRSSLTDAAGILHRKRPLIVRATTHRLKLEDLESEISAQITRVRDAGIRISHLDGHKHLHQLPCVSEAVARVAPRFGISRVRVTHGGQLSGQEPRQILREFLAYRARRAFERAELRSPNRMVDLKAMLEADRWRHSGFHLGRRGEIVELCCHPGTPAADLAKPGSHRRATELDFLLSGDFRGLLALHGARLVSYWQV